MSALGARPGRKGRRRSSAAHWLPADLTWSARVDNSISAQHLMLGMGTVVLFRLNPSNNSVDNLIDSEIGGIEHVHAPSRVTTLPLSSVPIASYRFARCISHPAATAGRRRAHAATLPTTACLVSLHAFHVFEGDPSGLRRGNQGERREFRQWRALTDMLEQPTIRLTISRICQVCGAFSFGDLIETRGDGLAEASDGESAVLERI